MNSPILQGRSSLWSETALTGGAGAASTVPHPGKNTNVLLAPTKLYKPLQTSVNYCKPIHTFLANYNIMQSNAVLYNLEHFNADSKHKGRISTNLRNLDGAFQFSKTNNDRAAQFEALCVKTDVDLGYQEVCSHNCLGFCHRNSLTRKCLRSLAHEHS